MAGNGVALARQTGIMAASRISKRNGRIFSTAALRGVPLVQRKYGKAANSARIVRRQRRNGVINVSIKLTGIRIAGAIARQTRIA